MPVQSQLPAQLQARKLEILASQKAEQLARAQPLKNDRLSPSTTAKASQVAAFTPPKSGQKNAAESNNPASGSGARGSSLAVQQLKEIYEKSYGRPFQAVPSRGVMHTEPVLAGTTTEQTEQNMSFGNSPKQSPIKHDQLCSYGSINADNIYKELEQIDEIDKKIQKALRQNQIPSYTSNKSLEMDEATQILLQLERLNQNPVARHEEAQTTTANANILLNHSIKQPGPDTAKGTLGPVHAHTTREQEHNLPPANQPQMALSVRSKQASNGLQSPPLSRVEQQSSARGSSNSNQNNKAKADSENQLYKSIQSIQPGSAFCLSSRQAPASKSPQDECVLENS